jgi:hypothetical protein
VPDKLYWNWERRKGLSVLRDRQGEREEGRGKWRWTRERVEEVFLLPLCFSKATLREKLLRRAGGKLRNRSRQLLNVLLFFYFLLNRC